MNGKEVGPSLAAGYLGFSLVAFIGSFFFYRSFCIAFPAGDKRLYALAAFFFPSIVYWSNGMGKDALMLLFIGLTAYGVARLMTNSFVLGMIPLILGLLGL